MNGHTVSNAAQELLHEAAKDADGEIVSIAAMGATTVTTNGRQFIEPENPQSTAKWLGALSELVKAGFVEDRTGKRNALYVSATGYDESTQSV